MGPGRFSTTTVCVAPVHPTASKPPWRPIQHFHGSVGRVGRPRGLVRASRSTGKSPGQPGENVGCSAPCLLPQLRPKGAQNDARHSILPCVTPPDSFGRRQRVFWLLLRALSFEDFLPDSRCSHPIARGARMNNKYILLIDRPGITPIMTA